MRRAERRPAEAGTRCIADPYSYSPRAYWHAPECCWRLIKLPPCAPPASQLAEAISDGASAPAPDADTGDEADGSDEADNRRLAHQFFLEKRSPDGKEIPYSLYAAAKEHARHMPTHSAHDRQLGPSQDSSDAGNGAGSPDSAAAPNAPLAPAASLTGWTQIGPGNIGGRVGALVIDPTAPLIMYAGSDGGGVYKTIDAGANWAPIGDAFTGLGVNAMSATLEVLSTYVPSLVVGRFSGELFGVEGSGVARSEAASSTGKPTPSPAT